MFEFCFINCQYARIYLTSALRCHKLWLFLFHFNYFKRNIFVRCLLRYVNSHTNIQRIQSKRHFKQFKNQGMFWHSWKKRNLKKNGRISLDKSMFFFLRYLWLNLALVTSVPSQNDLVLTSGKWKYWYHCGINI